jgi:outer membrane protein
MQMFKRVIMLLVLFSFVSAPLCFAEYKICTVDLMRVFEEYQKRKDFDSQLEAVGKEKDAQRNKYIEELKEIQDKMAVLSDAEKEKKQKELTDKSRQLQELDSKIRIDLRKDWDEKLRTVLNDIKKVVEELAKKEGYNFVIDGKALLYGSPENDVTDAVIKILNSRYKK